jgi:hypothetical protein
VVQAGFVLGLLEAFLDPPARSGHPDQFLRSSPATSPDTYSRTRPRGSDRVNRPAIRAGTRSNSVATKSTTTHVMIHYGTRECRCSTRPGRPQAAGEVRET